MKTPGSTWGFRLFASTPGGSQPRIDGFAFESENAKHTFVRTTQRLSRDEAFEGLNAQREFARGEGALGSYIAENIERLRSHNVGRKSMF